MNLNQAIAMVTEAMKSQDPTLYQDAKKENLLTTIVESHAKEMLAQISETMEAWLEENPNPTEQEMTMAKIRATEEAIAVWTKFQPIEETTDPNW